MRIAAKNSNSGVTLIELMIVIVIAAILMALAIPGFRDTIDRNRLKGATETIYSGMQFAKSEAIKRNVPIRVNFTTSNGGATWCYGLIENADCDCSDDAPLCQIDGIKKVVTGSSDYPGTVVTPSANFSFDNVRGTVNSGNIQIVSAQGKQTRVVMTGLGRVRICSPSGTANVPGYSSPCP